MADTSAIINLIATGIFHEIGAVTPSPFRVPEAVAQELDTGRSRGWKTPEEFDGLVRTGVVEIVTLGDIAMGHFESLVIGAAADTLDDGEAATIAYAQSVNGVPLIDERKARRICTERFPSLDPQSTAAFLTSEPLARALGATRVAEALFQALKVGRMQVPPADIARVVAVIGAERAKLCTSLPARVRVNG